MRHTKDSVWCPPVRMFVVLGGKGLEELQVPVTDRDFKSVKKGNHRRVREIGTS